MQLTAARNNHAFATGTFARKLFAVLSLGLLLTACQKDKTDNPTQGGPGNGGTVPPPPAAQGYFAAKNGMELKYRSSDDDGNTEHTLTVLSQKDSAGGKVVHYKTVFNDGTFVNPFVYTKDGTHIFGNTLPSELIDLSEELKNNPDVHDFSLTGVPMLQKLPANPQVGQLVEFSEPMRMSWTQTQDEDAYQTEMRITLSDGEVLGFEDVTTEAGTFKNCVRWRFKTTVTVDAAGHQDVTNMQTTMWYAKGIGLVKSSADGDKGPSSTQLIAVKNN